MGRRGLYPTRTRLQALGYESYRVYLVSPHWLATRQRYRDSDLPQECYCCGETEVHLHHKTYERLGAERLDDLVPLCARCHGLVHVLERRGDLDLDLTGLLDATRASVYATRQAEINARAAEDWHDTHEERRRREVVYSFSRRLRQLANVPPGPEWSSEISLLCADMDEFLLGCEAA